MVNISILEQEYGLTQEFFRKVLGGNMGEKPPVIPVVEQESDPEITAAATREADGVADDLNVAGKSEVLMAPPAIGDPTDDLARRLLMRGRLRSRIDEGMTRNFANYKLYYALDAALDTPFKQITPSLVRSLLDKDMEDDAQRAEVESMLTGWGLTQMLRDETDPKTGKKTDRKELNLATFVQVLVPLCISYVTARWAAVCNDELQVPFFKFEPAVLRTDYRIKCDVATARLDIMDRQFGYFDYFKQAVFKFLHYGSVFQFPQEEWWSEDQVAVANQMDVDAGELGDDDKPVAVGDSYWKVIKEGMRFHQPHPSRCYRDLAHPAVALLTDTGPTFSGYWRITRFRDIAFNPDFYNTSEIALADRNLLDLNRIFFQTVYGSMTLQYPTLTMGNQGVSDLDREKQVAVLYYGVDHFDQGILLTEHWEKLNPKRDGLVNPESPRGSVGYDGDVWFRFVVAGTNGTILYAAPVPSVGPLYAGYDADESRSMNQSMTLQIMPIQDHIGNVLTQMLLTMRQNLANLILIDQDMVDASMIERIKNAGEKFLRVLNILPFSSTRKKQSQTDPKMAVQSFSFPKGNLQEHVATIKTLIEILERLLGVSSQEVSQAASHEQTGEEIRLIGAAQSNRLQFTKTPMLRFKDAWKNQLYEYDMTYGQESFWCEIPCDTEILPETLKKLGFEVENLETKHGADKTIRVKYGPKVSPMPTYMFASARDDQDRYNNPQIAMAMTQVLQANLANPMTANAIGPDQAIALTNLIIQFAGLPKDFKLRALKTAPQNNPQQMVQAVLAEVMKQLQPEMQQIEGKVEQVSQQIGQANQTAGAAGKTAQDAQQQTQQTQAAISQLMGLLKQMGPVNPDQNAPLQPQAVASPGP